MEYFTKFVIGGFIMTTVSYFSTKGMPQIAGIIMTFPAITIASLLMSPAGQTKQIAIWGLVGVAAFTVFVLVFLVFVHYNGQQNKTINLTGSALIWIILVALIYYFINK